MRSTTAKVEQSSRGLPHTTHRPHQVPADDQIQLFLLFPIAGFLLPLLGRPATGNHLEQPAHPTHPCANVFEPLLHESSHPPPPGFPVLTQRTGQNAAFTSVPSVEVRAGRGYAADRRAPLLRQPSLLLNHLPLAHIAHPFEPHPVNPTVPVLTCPHPNFMGS